MKKYFLKSLEENLSMLWQASKNYAETEYKPQCTVLFRDDLMIYLTGLLIMGVANYIVKSYKKIVLIFTH